MNILLILYTLSFLLTFSGCSTALNRGISDSRYDAFANESLLRYTEERRKPIYKNEKSLLHSSIECHRKEFKKGLKTQLKAYKKRKEDPDYWNQVGMCYFLQKNYPKADFFFNLAISTAHKQKTSYPVAYNNLGVISLKQGHFQQALDYFFQAKKLKPILLSVDFNIAQLYLQFGFYKKATRLLERLYSKSPKDTDVLISLSMSHLMLDQFKEALAYIKKIDKKYIERIDISTIYALSLYLSGNFKLAYAIIKKHDNSEFTGITAANKKLKKIISNKMHEIRLKEKADRRKRSLATENKKL